DASDADTLAEELKRATTRNYRAYQSDLERIDGAETAEASPLIPRDTTQFLTTLHPLPADAHGPTNEVPTYFRLPVEDGEYYVVSAQSVLAPQVNTRATDSLYINAELVERDDLDTRYRCTGDGYESAHDGVNGIVTGTVYSRTIGQDCNTDELMLLLKRRGDWRQTEPIDVEVTVTRIDPFTLPDGRDAEPAAEADPALTVSPSTDTPAATTPGVWFSDAVDLTPGETVAVDIVAGETQFFRVPADYGQQVLGQLQVRDDAQNWDAYTHERRLELTAYNEARAELPLTEDVIFPEPEAVLDFGYTDPIFFQNRYEGTNRGFDARKLWQDGDQYLTVRYGDTTQGTINAASQLPPITYHLTLEVEGQPQPGPTFHPVDGRSEEETTTAEPTAEVDPDVTAQEAEDNGGGMGLWLGIGAVVLVLLGAGGFALSRRS
ncbi:hypothetical protein, partial [Corynebacterium sp.]|uniref:hypothetical protein n=1 Tax=Corynebacterium sp. TaxID=1720 RepID=UPI0026DFE50B